MCYEGVIEKSPAVIYGNVFVAIAMEAPVKQHALAAPCAFSHRMRKGSPSVPPAHSQTRCVFASMYRSDRQRPPLLVAIACIVSIVSRRRERERAQVGYQLPCRTEEAWPSVAH